MIIIYNFITLCQYTINKIVGNTDVGYNITFEEIDEGVVGDEPLCNCALCYIFEIIVLFSTRRMKYDLIKNM